MGQIRKRGQTYWIRYYRDGRRFEESARTKKESEAKKLLQVREGDIAKGVPVSPAIGRLKFEDAAKDLEHDYSSNKLKSEHDMLRRVRLHLKPFFGGRRMNTITTSDLRSFIVHRQKPIKQEDGTEKPGASNAEINRELAHLKRMFSLAIQAGKLLAKPHFPMLEENNVRTGFFERDQFEAVRSHLPPHMQPVATFAYLTGWRVYSEILKLEWRQVDLQAGVVRLDPGSTKNGDARVFPFGDALPELRDTLERQWQYTKATQEKKNKIIPLVFHRNGYPMVNLTCSWRKACEAAGCPDRIPHDFRRTAVRNLVRAGVPERVAMMLTGHRTRAIFDRYDIVNEGDLQTGIAKLGAAAGTNAGTIGRSGKVSRIKTKRIS